MSRTRRTSNNFGDRCFAAVGPRLWNSLPINLRQCHSLEQFKRLLKTFLFSAWGDGALWHLPKSAPYINLLTYLLTTGWDFDNPLYSAMVAEKSTFKSISHEILRSGSIGRHCQRKVGNYNHHAARNYYSCNVIRRQQQHSSSASASIIWCYPAVTVMDNFYRLCAGFRCLTWASGFGKVRTYVDRSARFRLAQKMIRFHAAIPLPT